MMNTETEFEVPNCLFCVHNLKCPVEYNRYNTACLTIYKNAFKELDKVFNNKKDHPKN